MKKSSINHNSIPPDLGKTNPQQALERILAAEISVAERISAANAKAEKAVAAARSGMDKIKAGILADARETREVSFNEGVKSAREEAEKMLAASRAETGEFTSRSIQYVSEAVEYVMGVLIGSEREAK